MTTKEIRDLLISTVLLAIAFGIAFSDGINAFKDITALLEAVFISFIAVSMGFILHELGHRFVARHYKFPAVYKMWLPGLFLAVGISLTGYIFAAPGAVHIEPATHTESIAFPDRKQMGKIAITGPLMNMLLAVIFYVALFLLLGLEMMGQEYPMLINICDIGASINALLAGFNLLPFGPMDGRKVIAWNKPVWLLCLLAAAGLYYWPYLL